jgi:hypothetical protein
MSTLQEVCAALRGAGVEIVIEEMGENLALVPSQQEKRLRHYYIVLLRRGRELRQPGSDLLGNPVPKADDVIQSLAACIQDYLSFKSQNLLNGTTPERLIQLKYRMGSADADAYWQGLLRLERQTARFFTYEEYWELAEMDL